MKNRILGTSQLKVSEICLGTMNFGWKEPQENSIERLEQYVDSGGNFIDTANVYSRREAEGMDFYGKDFDKYVDGTSERLIGNWVKDKGNRHNLVIATKVGFPYPGIQPGTSAVQIKTECEKSLKRLQTDYIDLLYLHMDDRNTSLEESLSALTDIVKEGKVRYIGVSNFTAWRLAKALEIADRYGFAKPCCVQQKHSYLRPKAGSNFGKQVALNDEMIELAKDSNISLLAYSPLIKGYYANPSKGLPEQYSGPDSDARMSVLRSIAHELDATNAQIVYSWLINSEPSVIPIVASSNKLQFYEALDSLKLDLTPEQMNKLNAAGI